MNPHDPIHVEAAVRAALAELGVGRQVANRLVASSTRHDVFAGPLLTLRHLEGLPERNGEVRVAPGTVITPLAREALKRAGVEVRVVSRHDAARPGEWGFAIEEETGVTGATRRSWLDDPSARWAEVGTTAVAAAGWVVDGPGRGAIVLTPEASVAAWLAGRIEGTRPATVFDADGAGRAVRHLGANLLVVEPAGKSIYQIRQVASAFRRGGAPAHPDIPRSLPDADRRGDRPRDGLAAAPEPAGLPVRDRPALDARRPDGRLALARRGGDRL